MTGVEDGGVITERRTGALHPTWASGRALRALAKQSGVSHRMIAYYEGLDALAPGHVLAELTKALGVSVDHLVGGETPKSRKRGADASRPLLRRLQQLEKLPLRDKRELLSIIDTYRERNRPLQKAS